MERHLEELGDYETIRQFISRLNEEVTRLRDDVVLVKRIDT